VFVQPAGAQLRSAPDEEALIKVWDEVGKCLGYPKPDGWRIQIHKQGSDVKLFSRSGKNWTKEFPDIIQVILSQVKDDQIILDTELVGFDRHGRHLAPSKLRDASQYRCYILDALYFGGENLTSLPTQKRVRLMKDHLLDSLMISLFSLNTLPSKLKMISSNFISNARQGRQKDLMEPLSSNWIPNISPTY